MIRKSNSIIVLLFIQNNCQFKNIAKKCKPLSMLSSSSIVHVQGCFRVVQLRKYYFAQFFLSKRVKRVRHFCFHNKKKTLPRPQVFSVKGELTCKKAAFLTSSVHYTQNSSKFGYQQLVMVNYACAFSQSESGKHFE